MTENKSYELTINERGQLEIIDHIEGKKTNAICIYNDLGVFPFSSAKAVCDKLNEQDKLIKELEREKEFWKGDACNCSNCLSILSMDCQIVQEAIWGLKNVIDVDTEAFKLLDELDCKFDELNQHRIRCMR